MEVTSINGRSGPGTRSWKVLSPVDNRGKTRWISLGRAYLNKDGSTNVYLDAYPANGRLQLRDWDEESSGPHHARSQPAPAQDDMPF